MGGFIKDSDEEMAVGSARTGATVGVVQLNDIAGAVGLFAALGPDYVLNPAPAKFVRPDGSLIPVDSNIEFTEAYRTGVNTLHFYDPIKFDVRLNVWSDSPGTNAYVYRRVLEAVDKHYEVNP